MSTWFLWCLVLVRFVDSQFSRQKDDELCKAITETNDEYTCESIDRCPVVLRAIEDSVYPRICRFRGRTPIVCCPTYPDVVVVRRAAEKCREYYSLTTRGGGTIESGGCRTKKTAESLTIVGGTTTKESEFPHMVLLGFGENFKNVEWACGGSLISDRYVLSAAHCSVIGKKGSIKWAQLGDHVLGTNEENAYLQVREVVQHILHPEYKPQSVYNDIGLYRLNTSVEFNRFVMPICINTEMQSVAEEVIAIGWGRTSSADHTSNILMKVSLDLIEHKECNRSYSFSTGKNLALGINPDSQICAGKREGGKDTCQGDSGGPLQIFHPVFECMYTQIGITSFGKICGEPNAPGVYTRVSNYVSWIDDIVWPTS